MKTKNSKSIPYSDIQLPNEGINLIQDGQNLVWLRSD